MSIAVGVTCLFGFPAAFIIVKEVTAAVSTNADEKDYLSSKLLPKLLIGGFSTVTIGAVFVGSFVLNYL